MALLTKKGRDYLREEHDPEQPLGWEGNWVELPVLEFMPLLDTIDALVAMLRRWDELHGDGWDTAIRVDTRALLAEVDGE